MIPSWRSIFLAVAALAAVHGLLWLLPASLLSPPNNLVLFAANLYVLYAGWLVLRHGGREQVGLFAAGYLLLFLLLAVLLQRESLFVLLAILYASVFRVRLLLGFFVIFVLSYVVFQPYAFETFLPLSLSWYAVWRVKKEAGSTFLAGSLAAGLLVLGVVLLPLFHLLAQDSPQTLLFALERADVRQAIWLSLVSSGVSTLLVVLWGVPLAYALARADFRGKGVLESIIDLPILVPQSVVGIALMTLLGPGSPAGQALEEMGLPLAGRLAGIVLAQMFVACPFLIKTAQSAFEAVPENLEAASRTLGAGPAATFFRVSLPLASRGIFVGVILAWARAISEFGSVILFAPHPQTAPVLAHNEFLRAGVNESRPVAVLLLLCCLWVFIVLQFGKTLLPTAWCKPRVTGGGR